ncbi:MAG: DNA pilot protein [Microvirus sp.]|nr:MAG: DNA pilot protein [Microvirus sp.]
MSIWKKIGKRLKKIAPYALAAGGAYMAVPGLSSAISGAFSPAGGSVPQPGASDFNGPIQEGYSGGTGSADNPYSVHISGSKVKPPPPSGFDFKPYLGAAGSLISGGLNYVGAQKANAANAEQAQKQMDFQAEQTGTAYQRGTADMKAAGLNPMLAYSQGGASSGGGAQAQMGNEAGTAANSAIQAAGAIASISNTKAQTENINAQTDNTRVDTELRASQLDNAGSTRNLQGAQTAAATASAWELNKRIEYLDSQIKNLEQTTKRGSRTFEDDVRLRKLEANRQDLQNQLLDFELPGARNEARFQNSAVGQYSPEGRAIGRSVSTAVQAAGALRGRGYETHTETNPTAGGGRQSSTYHYRR